MTTQVRRSVPTVEQILDQQTKQAERELQGIKANLPAVQQAQAPALIDAPAVSSADEYLNRNPGGMVIGHPIRPNAKLGKFMLGDSDGTAPDVDYTVITESITVGWVRLRQNSHRNTKPGSYSTRPGSSGSLAANLAMPIRHTGRFPSSPASRPTPGWNAFMCRWKTGRRAKCTHCKSSPSHGAPRSSRSTDYCVTAAST